MHAEMESFTESSRVVCGTQNTHTHEYITPPTQTHTHTHTRATYTAPVRKWPSADTMLCMSISDNDNLFLSRYNSRMREVR